MRPGADRGEAGALLLPVLLTYQESLGDAGHGDGICHAVFLVSPGQNIHYGHLLGRFEPNVRTL